MRRLAVLLGVAMLALVASCGGPAGQALWRDDFETVCGGSPCGWTQVAGPAGAVTWVETVPSEHGLELSGDGVAISRMAPGDEVIGSDPVIDSAGRPGVHAHVVARCDPGSTLTLIVTLQNVAGGPPMDVSGNATYPSSWDGTRTTFDLFPTDPSNAMAQFVDILGVVFHKQGPGLCEVDYVSLADQSVRFFE